MAESLNHITYVRRIVEYAKDIPSAFIPNCLLADLPDFPERPIATLDGYIPDVLYNDSHTIIIGEAKLFEILKMTIRNGRLIVT